MSGDAYVCRALLSLLALCLLQLTAGAMHQRQTWQHLSLIGACVGCISIAVSLRADAAGPCCACISSHVKARQLDMMIVDDRIPMPVTHAVSMWCVQDSPAGAMAIAGVVGGVFAASASHPFDTIKTRMQAHMYSKPEYVTWTSTASQIYKEGGVLNFWRGLLPRMTRIIGRLGAGG